MFHQKAYSLLELVLFFVITAILYQGLFGAKFLLKASYSESIVKEIKSFENATIKFYNQYQFLPGDFADITKLSNSKNLLAGNADGYISDLSESLQFWFHLKEANLIEGNFDGASYSLAKNEIMGGIPESKIAKQLAYIIEVNPDIRKITLIIAGYSEDKKNLAYFTPSEAADIIKLLGNSTDYNNVFDGEDVPKGSCLIGNKYNIQNSEKACYIKYNFPDFKKTQNKEISDLNYTKCNGSILGTIRISDNEICPINKEGSVKQICNQEGQWINYNFDCHEVKCLDSLYLNDVINVACPANSTGYNQFRCNEIGVLEPLSTTDNCFAQYKCHESEAHRNLACPLNYNELNSKWLQICDDIWKNESKNCTQSNLTCNLGQKRNNITISDICPIIGYKSSSISPIEACLFTPDGIGWRLIRDNCLPDYNGDNCVSGDKRILPCPKTKTGSVEQICNDEGYYETIKDNCISAKCGQYKIGSFKIKEGYNCPEGSLGDVIEVCDYEDELDMHQAIWKISYQNCQKLVCPAVSDGVGNYTNYWPTSNANNLVEVTCSNNIDKAIRFCQPDGNWAQIPDQSCP